MPITKKPWKRIGHNGYMIVGNERKEKNTDGDTIIKSDVVCLLRGSIDFPNIEENGKIIEQAPEMYQMLLGFRDYYQVRESLGNRAATMHINDINTIIRKIEGK